MDPLYSEIIPTFPPKMVEVAVCEHGLAVLKQVPAQDVFNALKGRYIVQCSAFCHGDLCTNFLSQIDRAYNNLLEFVCKNPEFQNQLPEKFLIPRRMLP